MSTEQQGTWARLAAQDGPNPLWFWPLVAYVWAGLAGGWASHTGYPWESMLIGGALLVPVGLLVGRVLVREGKKSPEGQAARQWAGFTAAGYLAVLTAWCTYAAATDVLRPVDFPAFGVLAVGMLPVALMYAHVRASLLEHEDLVHDAPPPLTPKAVEGVPTVVSAEALEFLEVLRDKGCGNNRIQKWEDQWSGPRITVELDQEQDIPLSMIRMKLEGITLRLSRLYKARGIQLPNGAITVREADSADVVVFTIRLRDVLAEDIPVPPDAGPTTCNLPLWLGLYESGEPMEVDIRWRHGMAIGGTGSGKSTYENMIVYQLTRCVDALVWMCGTSKLMELAGPWLQALADGRASRSVIDFVGGQSWDDVERLLRVAYLLIKVRETAPRAMYKREKNRLLPTPDQPLVHVVCEESDTLMRSLRLIEIPGEQPMTAAAILMYGTSKGRQYGVQFELLNQGVTQNKMGNLATEIKDSITRRAALHTQSKMMGQWALPDGVDMNVFNTSKLPEHCMYLTNGRDAEPARAKAAYINEDTAIPEAAIAHQTWVTTLEPYAQQQLQKLLGSKFAGDYADRWSYERTQVWREYFGEFPYVASKQADAPAAERSGGGTTTVTGEGKPSPTKGGVWGEQNGQPGWFYGAFFVPDLSVSHANAGNAAEADGELSPEWQATLDQIQSLQTVEPERPPRHPVPEPLGTVVRALDDCGDEFVTSARLAELAGMDSAELGLKLTKQGVPGRKRGGERGRLVSELRAAADAHRRGEKPAAAADE